MIIARISEYDPDAKMGEQGCSYKNDLFRARGGVLQKRCGKLARISPESVSFLDKMGAQDDNIGFEFCVSLCEC